MSRNRNNDQSDLMNLAEAELGALQEDSDDHVKTSVVSPAQGRADRVGVNGGASINNSYLPAIDERSNINAQVTSSNGFERKAGKQSQQDEIFEYSQHGEDMPLRNKNQIKMSKEDIGDGG